MKAYQPFIETLKTGFNIFSTSSKSLWEGEALRYIDGLAADELRRLVDLGTRKEYGAFFTNSDLAVELLSEPKCEIKTGSIVYDPACGAGNLLIAAANLKLSSGFLKVKLLGTDLHNEFVEATRLRLGINELLKDRRDNSYIYDAQILAADGLKENSFYKTATHVVTNPPFNLLEAGKNISWSSGKVSAAALFIDHIINNINAGTKVIAILPDVLRSGSRYEKWRKIIENSCIIDDMKLLGQFDKFADVDIFSLVLTKKNTANNNELNSTPSFSWTNENNSLTVLKDKFEVSVGSVVDNRDVHEGLERPYLVSKGLAAWEEIKSINKVRCHKGKSISGPFVVIKRTSRLGDPHRTIATIINNPEPIYVDNHLIIVKPLTGKLSDCKIVLSILKKPQTTHWINDQIRCRHLTVKVVSNIPL